MGIHIKMSPPHTHMDTHTHGPAAEPIRTSDQSEERGGICSHVRVSSEAAVGENTVTNRKWNPSRPRPLGPWHDPPTPTLTPTHVLD